VICPVYFTRQSSKNNAKLYNLDPCENRLLCTLRGPTSTLLSCGTITIAISSALGAAFFRGLLSHSQHAYDHSCNAPHDTKMVFWQTRFYKLGRSGNLRYGWDKSHTGSRGQKIIRRKATPLLAYLRLKSNQSISLFPLELFLIAG